MNFDYFNKLTTIGLVIITVLFLINGMLAIKNKKAVLTGFGQGISLKGSSALIVGIFLILVSLLILYLLVPTLFE
jgi:hypothetical protein